MSYPLWTSIHKPFWEWKIPYLWEFQPLLWKTNVTPDSPLCWFRSYLLDQLCGTHWRKGLRSAAQSPAGGGPVTTEIPLDLIPRPVLLNIFINDLDDDTECVHSNSANSQNLGEWLIPRMEVLPFRGTWKGCWNELTRLMIYSIKGNAKSWTWGGVTPYTNTYKCLTGESKEGGQDLLRGNLWRQKSQWAQTEIQGLLLQHKKKLFTLGVVKHWNKLPGVVVLSHLWRYSKPMWSWATCCRWPCCGQGLGLNNLPWCLPRNLPQALSCHLWRHTVWYRRWDLVVLTFLSTVVRYRS